MTFGISLRLTIVADFFKWCLCTKSAARAIGNQDIPVTQPQPAQPKKAPLAAVQDGARAKAAPKKPANAAAAKKTTAQKNKPAAPVPPPARAAKVKGRHLSLVVSFFVFVVLPATFAGWYLWERATDQYASTVGFSVRTEEATSPVELLGGISALSGSSTSDTDILYEFIQSQELVSRVDQQLDLRGLWSLPENDPLFAYQPPGTIEDLVQHWGRMVRIYYDSGSGLIEIRALAFDPESARQIAEVIFAESSNMINTLNDAAREDALRYARVELEASVERLKKARTAITAFRNRTQIVDPSIDMQTQAGLLGNLQSQQAEALIELDLLEASTRAGDSRIEQARRRVEVIEARILEERRKLGIGNGDKGGAAFADLFGEFESLAVDREFAEQAYIAALAGYDSAVADARRQSRYLAAHILPTLAEKSQFPQRFQLLSIFTLFLFLTWSICILIAYSLRDRR